jgi:hypothetical protein
MMRKNRKKIEKNKKNLEKIWKKFGKNWNFFLKKLDIFFFLENIGKIVDKFRKKLGLKF